MHNNIDSPTTQIFLNHAKESLQKQNPSDVCARTGAIFDSEQGEYELTVLGSPARIAVSDCSLAWRWPIRPMLHIITLHYLIHADGSTPKGELISLHDAAPMASTRIEHILKANIPPLTECFAADMESFHHGVSHLGGKMLTDSTAELIVFPHLPTQITIWPADDEFPADARILFDRTLKGQLPGESIVYVPDFAVQTLVAAAGKKYTFFNV